MNTECPLPPPPSRDNSHGSQRDTNEHRHVSATEEEFFKQEILDAALEFVPQHGWTEAALVAGAESLHYPAVAAGAFPRGGAALVEHFIASCNDAMSRELAATDMSRSFTFPHALSTSAPRNLSPPPLSCCSVQHAHPRQNQAGIGGSLAHARAGAQHLAAGPFGGAGAGAALFVAGALTAAPVCAFPNRSSQALAIMALPQNAVHALELLYLMVDEMWFYAGDEAQATDVRVGPGGGIGDFRGNGRRPPSHPATAGFRSAITQSA